MVRAAFVIILALTGCAERDDAGACPWFSNEAIYIPPRGPLEFRDNADQCEMYWLVRFVPVAASATEAVQGAITECRSARILALKTESPNVTPDGIEEHIRQRRDQLLPVALKRKQANCARTK